MFRVKKNLSPDVQLSYQRGAIAIEMAIVSIVMLLIIAGAIGFGRAYWYADALSKSTRNGARHLSTWPILDLANMNGTGRDQARTLTKNIANAANINPLLGDSNVVVECLDSSFVVVADCGTLVGANPITANVRVSITAFSINLSEWFPFVGGQAFGNVDFSPATTMRYMK